MINYFLCYFITKKMISAFYYSVSIHWKGVSKLWRTLRSLFLLTKNFSSIRNLWRTRFFISVKISFSNDICYLVEVFNINCEISKCGVFCFLMSFILGVFLIFSMVINSREHFNQYFFMLNMKENLKLWLVTRILYRWSL